MPTSLRYALRSLGRTPAFTVAVILTLVLGLGSVASMFAIVDGVLLEPLPYGHPDRLVSVGLQTAEVQRIQQPPAVYFTYKRFARTIVDVGFHRTGNANIWTGDGAVAPERVTATWLTASVIPLLQVKPILGRSFTADEERLNGPNVAILSESVWRTRFNSARDVIGKTLYANSVPREIIGVMPEGFAFPTAETRLWLPARIDPSALVVGDFSYTGVARLAPNATPALAQHELAQLLPRMAESFARLESGTATDAWLDQAHATPVVVALRDEVTGGIARTLWILGGAAGLVLLVAWANVANLLLIRGDGRQLELAVREALGASRLRIATHFLGEPIVLTAAAAAIALAVAWGAVRALVAFGPADVPRLAELGVGLTTVAFVVVMSVAGVIICGAVPAIRLRRASLSINLRDGARGETAGRTRQRLRGAIASLQIAVALVVSVGSALLLRTFQRLYEERPGFDATNVMTIWTQLPFARYGDSASVSFYARLTELAGQIPGVRAVGLTTQLPLGAGETREQSFRVEGEGRTVSLPTHVVDDGYFATLKIPVLAGRGFQRLGAQRHGDVVISQRAAATIFNDSTGVAALGRRLGLAPSGPTYTVVGVVGDVRDHDLATAPSATVYTPQVVPADPTVEPGARRTMALVVRTAGPSAAVVSGVRQVVRDLDPTVPIFNVETMSDVVRASTARLSLALALMTVAAAITLLLGTIGLYGVMAYMVALRARELAVRVALGASPRQLAQAIAVRGFVLVGSGVAAGFVLYAIAAPFLQAFLYGVTATDPSTLIVVTLVLVVTASLASWLPARRAARVDPSEALRAD
ncbi:MAG TPA: ADOP family duplicated permease [Gemmatimonadaceae bacterium]|nr:ADOP family duplicated permease [Gemmatimonadaceae bacterium]